MPPVQTRLPSHATVGPQDHTRPRSRPGSVSSSTLVQSPAPIHHTTPYQRQPPPYMVALSGWPEPVFISNLPSSRSRPGSPKQYRDGVALSRSITPIESKPVSPSSSSANDTSGNRHPIPSPADSILSKTCVHPHASACSANAHPDHHDQVSFRTKPRQHRSEESYFPTSSTRSTPNPSPPGSAMASPPAPVQSPQTPQTPQTYGSRHSHFNDPRFGPNVAVLNRGSHLPIAPYWSSASGSNPHAPARVGMQVAAGERGTGLLIMRSVPDVYPPPAPAPGMAGGMASMTRSSNGPAAANGRVGVATEVYPRDPDRLVLWGGIAPRQDASTDHVSDE